MSVAIIERISIASFHYVHSNETLAMEKDGQQTFRISVLAALRLSMLSEQLHATMPNLPYLHLGKIIFFMGLLPSVIQPLAESYLEQSSNSQDSIAAQRFRTACRLIISLGKKTNSTFQHADKIINTACCVSYLALIALGFHATGMIGLAGLFILALKRYGYLPSIVDQYFDPSTRVLSFLSIIIGPFSLMRIPFITFSIIDLIVLASNHHLINQYLPEWTRNPLHGEHHYVKHNWKLEYENRSIKVNRSHVYTNSLETLIPQKFCDQFEQQGFEQQGMEELFTTLEARMQEAKIELNEEEKDGLKKIKMGAIRGRVEDQLPNDVEKFQKIMFSLIQSILDDKLNFTSKIKELASLGNNCVEGWTRDINYMFFPLTTDIQWAVHFELAKQRGAIINEFIGRTNHFFSECSLVNPFKMVGGNNNIHFVNSTHALVWHHFRTLEGEFNWQLRSQALLPALAIRYLLPRNGFSSRLSSIALDLFYGSILGNSSSALLLSIAILGEIKSYFDKPNLLIDHIYEAIKPEYAPVEGTHEIRRKIAWEAVEGWLSQLPEEFGLANGYDGSKWVERDIHEQFLLTKEGVKLLLLDLGILTLH